MSLRPSLCDEGHQKSCDSEPYKATLVINSPGGDMVAAITAARVMSRRDWAVHVKKDHICSSACIFLASAANERTLHGQIGIHRIFPLGTNAKTRESLDKQLADITSDARGLFRENGVNPSLIDEMMTIPSSKVRILSRTELDAYGLGHENSASLDLKRAEIVRMCGVDFSRRLIEAEALSEPCGGSGSGNFDQYIMCLNAGYEQLGFPDAKCPKKGPKFWCPDPKERDGYRLSFERCDIVGADME